jgi:molybdate transport system regulatory protein
MVRQAPAVLPQLRVLLGSPVAMGPGKAALLEAIAAEGSISGAARAMGMSYRRAWILVDGMNRAFKAPLVRTATGGPRGGGARLTKTGITALNRYRAMEAKAHASVAADMRKMRALMHPTPRTRGPANH